MVGTLLGFHGVSGVGGFIGQEDVYHPTVSRSLIGARRWEHAGTKMDEVVR